MGPRYLISLLLVCLSAASDSLAQDVKVYVASIGQAHVDPPDTSSFALYRDSIALASHILSEEPSDWAYLKRSFFREKVGDHVGAIADLDKAIEMHPTDYAAFNSRAFSREKLND